MTTERTVAAEATIDGTDKEAVRAAVREQYGKIARVGAMGSPSGCCAPSPAQVATPAAASCCGPAASEALGYGAEALAALPEGADLGLGCGNPQAIAALREGETVLDLGAGAGIDCFLAARAVGPTGRVIGVDMTSDMVVRARKNAAGAGVSNVEFRLGEIEHLPMADGTVDVIMSNCVINLSPDKPQVFRDAFRVLKPGGRLAISDVVALRPLSEALMAQAATLTGCVSGAALVSDTEQQLLAAGFSDVTITVNHASRDFIAGWFPGSGAEEFVASATIEARRPLPED